MERAFGIRKQATHRITGGFDQTAVMTRQHLLHRGKTGVDEFQRIDIAVKTVQGRALHDVGKQNREIVTMAVGHV